jgi:Domain of unknown function (DUF4129)
MACQKRARSAGFLALLLCGLPLVAFGQQNSAVSPEKPLNMPAYIEELDRWSKALESLKTNPGEAQTLRQELPQHWPVAAGAQRIEVSTSWLRAGLNEVKKDPKSAAERARLLLAHVAGMRSEAQDLAVAAHPFDGSARQKLNEILSRPEFNEVHGPTWVDRLAERIADWLSRLMERFDTGMAGHQWFVKLLFWALFVGAAGALLVWMARRLLQRSKTQKLSLSAPGPAVVRSSRQLAGEARENAERGDFREAIRFAYWAAIHRLEELGLWSVDHTRTHREYLRLVGSLQPQREPLAALTRQFELAWYAVRPASQSEYQTAVAQLEKLGCALPSEPMTNRS